MSDLHTISSLREGDRIVFRLVFDEYHARVYAYIYRKTLSSYLAEEAMQITFVKLWNYRRSLRPELSLFTQIFRIASTTMIDLLRSEEKDRVGLQSIKKQTELRLDPLQSMEENLLKKKVNTLIRQMPTMQKRVFEMSRFENKSYREIALALSISIKTVETHISRALKFLRQNLTLFSVVFLCCLITMGSARAQDPDLFNRLQGNSQKGVDFWNVDGIQITIQTFKQSFSEKAIIKEFGRYGIQEKDLTEKDDSLRFANRFVIKTEDIDSTFRQYTAYYFIENQQQTLTTITFVSVNKTAQAFERSFVSLVHEQALPRDNFPPFKIDSLNFAGRKFEVGNSCRWMGVNDVQCPGNGQMNWSIHADSADAQVVCDAQFAVNKKLKGVRLLSAEQLPISFEGHAVTVRKAIFDFKGVNGLLVRANGGKTLTVYYVAAPVRGHFVSCTLSYWDIDSLTPDGLPMLLEQVMTLHPPAPTVR